MKSIIFLLLFPVLAWSQTYAIESVTYDGGTFIKLPGQWTKSEETVTVIMGRVSTIYHLNAPMETSEGQAFLSTSGSDSYMVMIKDLDGTQKGQTVLAIYSPVTESTTMYFGRKVTKPKK
jgi:hypothetical protein